MSVVGWTFVVLLTGVVLVKVTTGPVGVGVPPVFDPEPGLLGAGVGLTSTPLIEITEPTVMTQLLYMVVPTLTDGILN